MRELILKMSISLDGFVAAVDAPNSWMFSSDQIAKDWSVAMLWEAGLHVMGSATFRDMAAHWPTATDPFAPPMNAIPKAVVSRPGSAVLDGIASTAGSWATAQVIGGDLAAGIAGLKSQDGKPIIAHGGVRFARSLIAARLVDRFMLLVAPVALSRGLPLFSDLAAPLRLALVASQVFPGGAVAQTYRPA